MPPQPIALVLAGGGARGAYEVGALSALLPALPEAQRPNVILGTSAAHALIERGRADAEARLSESHDDGLVDTDRG